MVNYSLSVRQQDTNSPSHLPRDFVQVSSEKSNNEGLLQLLLFINKRPASQEQIQNTVSYTHLTLPTSVIV